MMYEYHGLTPTPQQLQTIAFMLANKRGYNFSDMGSGKTASSLWAADMLLGAGKIKKVLIICPLSLMKSVWVKEIENIIPWRKYVIVHGDRRLRALMLAQPVDFYIINHDGPKFSMDMLIQYDFDVIIIDEVDNYKHFKPADKKTRKHNKTSAVKLLCDRAKSVFGLTGTPIANSPKDAFGIAKIVNPDKLPTPYVTRWQQMTMFQVGPFHWIPKEDAVTIVHNTLQPAIRFSLEECTTLPPCVMETIEFEMCAEQERVYADMYEDQVAEYKDGMITAMTAAVKVMKLLQIAAGCVYDQDGNVIVLPLKDKLEQILHVQAQAGQLVVFCQFVQVARRLNAELEGSRLIYGDVNLNDRATILDDFKAGKFDILIAQPRTMAHGVNLQFCNTIIFFGPIHGNNFYRQAIARVRRTGQTKPQLVINFSSCEVERKLYKMLNEKEITSQALLSLYKN
jgi:SNF2 family DNA or RNA helicase